MNTNKYVTSFCGVAPIDNPQAVLLITLYNPTGEGGHQGGGVAAPLGGQIFSEILPYLEVSQGNQDEVEVVEQVETPDLIGKSITEAEKIVKESGLELVIQNEDCLLYTSKRLYIWWIFKMWRMQTVVLQE